MTTAIYSEEGWTAKVEILEDNSDNEWQRLKLKVLEVIKENPVLNMPAVDEIFDVRQKHAYYGVVYEIKRNKE